ncbi:Protein of unknown function [Propionibacterium cyclohexanicum]|uniref:Uncharacterized protein n=1 Tax=Propionibacterium cyclohexanicum TaxID=64702 RepID=A0A1H9TS21_9ACTN|nr:DUF3040 domain-containing protein [Propionibacterium cyclohexanicum]SER99942.1 Protein of unknown function [Propionibacterium cyclohexanicum]
MIKDDKNDPGTAADAEPDPRFAGPPIFDRPTPEELPPADQPWKRRVGLPVLLIGVCLLVLGILALAMHSNGILLVVVGLLATAAGGYLLGANSRALKAWRAEHEPPAQR